MGTMDLPIRGSIYIRACKFGSFGEQYFRPSPTWNLLVGFWVLHITVSYRAQEQ